MRNPGRRVWAWGMWGGLGVLVVLVLVFNPITLAAFRFSESALRGMTPREVIARCGEPTFASTPGASGGGEYIFPGQPVWARMDQAARDGLTSRTKFMFGYYAGIGDRFSVQFENGLVVRVTHSAR